MSSKVVYPVPKDVMKNRTKSIPIQSNGISAPVLNFSTPHDGEPAPEIDSQGYRIREQPYGTKRKLKVILMGAGASTLNFLKKAEEEMQNLEITVYEKNDGVGGTWLENRYPGCACDIPAVNYQFSWKIKTWEHYYAFSPEILEYFKDIERENQFIDKYIKLKHRVESAKWDDDRGIWCIDVRDLQSGKLLEDEAEFFINAGGVLNNWKWPEIPGLHDFQRKLMHSAAYDVGYSLKGKKVAVIGAGSSGVQIVAAIQKEADQLYHWVKNPIWITAGFAQRWAGYDGANFACKKACVRYNRKLTMRQILKGKRSSCKKIPRNISNIANRSRTS
jgi:cation diffusion facilitator CzcD-associated flavoprotein CzcO